MASLKLYILCLLVGTVLVARIKDGTRCKSKRDDVSFVIDPKKPCNTAYHECTPIPGNFSWWKFHQCPVGFIARNGGRCVPGYCPPEPRTFEQGDECEGRKDYFIEEIDEGCPKILWHCDLEIGGNIIGSSKYVWQRGKECPEGEILGHDLRCWGGYCPQEVVVGQICPVFAAEWPVDKTPGCGTSWYVCSDDADELEDVDQVWYFHECPEGQVFVDWLNGRRLCQEGSCPVPPTYTNHGLDPVNCRRNIDIDNGIFKFVTREDCRFYWWCKYDDTHGFWLAHLTKCRRGRVFFNIEQKCMDMKHPITGKKCPKSNRPEEYID